MTACCYGPLRTHKARARSLQPFWPNHRSEGPSHDITCRGNSMGSILHCQPQQPKETTQQIRKTSVLCKWEINDPTLSLHQSIAYHSFATYNKPHSAYKQHPVSFHIAVWIPFPDNLLNQSNYCTVAEQNEKYKGTTLHTSFWTVCYMLKGKHSIKSLYTLYMHFTT